MKETPGTPSTPAPLALFAYMRVDHLRRCVKSLQANPEASHSELTIFCDAARRPEHTSAVAAVRDYVQGITGFRSVRHVFRTHNFGLARSVINGVSQLLAHHERVIVLEDDLLLSPHFLRYMNDGLQLYADDARVASIHGYVYPVRDPLPQTFFLRGADCWGWATWARAWRHFDADGSALLARLRDGRLTRAFDLGGAFPYTAMLEDQIAGRNDSWAIRWHASCFADDLLTLYPGRSLVENIGNDASGTHCAETGAFSQAPVAEAIAVTRISPIESEPARRAIARFLRAQRPSLISRTRQLLRGLQGRAA